MIMAQEREFLKAQSELQGIVAYVRETTQRGGRIDQVERELFRRLLGLGHTLLAAFVEGQGDGDVGPTAELEEGREVRRLEEPHARRYVSVFGELEITRRVYGTRAKQKIEFRCRTERVDVTHRHRPSVEERFLQGSAPAAPQLEVRRAFRRR